MAPALMTKCEPAPTAADGGNEDDGMEFEPAPTAARGDSDGPMQEPAPTAARDKRTTIESLGTAEDGEANLLWQPGETLSFTPA